MKKGSSPMKTSKPFKSKTQIVEINVLRERLGALLEASYRLLNVTRHPLANLDALPVASEVQQIAETEIALARAALNN